jgi:hypothetical protein
LFGGLFKNPSAVSENDRPFSANIITVLQTLAVDLKNRAGTKSDVAVQ